MIATGREQRTHFGGGSIEDIVRIARGSWDGSGNWAYLRRRRQADRCGVAGSRGSRVAKFWECVAKRFPWLGLRKKLATVCASMSGCITPPPRKRPTCPSCRPRRGGFGPTAPGNANRTPAPIAFEIAQTTAHINFALIGVLEYRPVRP